MKWCVRKTTEESELKKEKSSAEMVICNNGDRRSSSEESKAEREDPAKHRAKGRAGDGSGNDGSRRNGTEKCMNARPLAPSFPPFVQLNVARDDRLLSLPLFTLESLRSVCCYYPLDMGLFMGRHKLIKF